MDPISSGNTSSTNACSYDELTTKPPPTTEAKASTQKEAAATANASYAASSATTPAAPTSKPPAIDLTRSSVDVASWPGALLERNYASLRKEVEANPQAATAEKLDLLARMEKEMATRDESGPPLAPVTKPPNKVELCERHANIPIVEYTPLKHWWLRTNDTELGQGPQGGGMPGVPGQPSGYPLVPTTLNDHTGLGDSSTSACIELHDVDPDCVEAEMVEGAAKGRWFPGLNDCHGVVEDIVEDCRVGPKTYGDSYVDVDL